MPAANPIVGNTTAPGVGMEPDSQAPGAGGAAPADMGMDDLFSDEHTPMVVAALVIGSVAVVAFFHIAGFRFAVDVGLTRG